MRPSTLLPAVLSILTTTQAAIKTSIYIDQIPAYSSLAPCAENRVSAVVRAQASGCGDEQQLTSFSCFCVEQYSHISSVISTAVQDYCGAQATTLTASATAPLPEVTSAIEVFNSYCARSTELAWCKKRPHYVQHREADIEQIKIIVQTQRLPQSPQLRQLHLQSPRRSAPQHRHLKSRRANPSQ